MKIWNVDLKTIPLPWLSGKFPMPTVREIIENNILRNDESEMVHSIFNYPKNNGSSYIAETLAKNIHISYNAIISEIIKAGPQWEINTQ